MWQKHPHAVSQLLVKLLLGLTDNQVVLWSTGCLLLHSGCFSVLDVVKKAASQ